MDALSHVLPRSCIYFFTNPYTSLFHFTEFFTCSVLYVMRMELYHKPSYDIELSYIQERKPIDIARSEGHSDIVNLLEGRGH